VSRPLFFYVKKAHVDVIPGLRGFLREFTSDRAWGDEGYLSERGLIPMPVEERSDEGYLSERGLIPMPVEERSQVAAAVRELTPLKMASQ
jgi:phosphate transport system substrate-binding protein